MTFRPPTLLARLMPVAPLLLALTHPAVQAQPRTEASATAATPVIDDAEQALMLAFGHRAGLARLADHFVDRLVAEARVGQFFRDTPPARLKQRLADQFCQALSGSCAYDAQAATQPLAEPALRRADFLALADLLQDSMDAQAVPPAAQDALLARLAPMQRRLVMR